MRVIGGEFRGRKLYPIRGMRGSEIRPTAGRVRAAVFNILSVQVRGAAVLDLFAGAGTFGLEALSRGAKYAVFVDGHRNALLGIERSIRELALDNRARAVKWNIARNLDCIRAMAAFPDIPYAAGQDRLMFDLVFVDPPYNSNMIDRTLLNLYTSEALSEDAVVIVEHTASEPIPEGLYQFRTYDERSYGGTVVSFLDRRV